MKGKTLKYLIFIWGAICLYIFIAVRFESMFNGILKEDVVEGYWDKTEYGELYYFSMIRHFREEGLPPAQPKFEYSNKQADVANCDILVFGDSFFEFSRHKQVPERIADDLQKQVHFVNEDNPIEYLQKQNYQDTVPKLVILERVERFIPNAFENELVLDNASVPEQTTLDKLSYYILEKLFYPNSEQLYDVILKRSYVSTNLYSFFATLKFDLYGKISNMTPAYLKDKKGSWLFYHDQVNDEKSSFYYQFTEMQIDSICDNMESLAENLLENYNMQIVYLPLPGKYTLYHHLLNEDAYNEFLPRLYEGLDKRSLKYIDVYSQFRDSDTLLFYRSDSHWNQKGIDITYRETLEYLRQDSVLNTYL